MTLKRILVVDDNEDDQFIASVQLGVSHPGLEIVAAFDGVEALELLAKGEHFDMILLDINMPRMGGLEFLEHYSDRDITPPVVVMLTSSAQERDRATAHRYACVTSFLQKPLSREGSRSLDAALG